MMELRANLIIKAIYNQVDDDSFNLSLCREIIGHEYYSKALYLSKKNSKLKNYNAMNP
jgi:hypothetical protein